MNVAKFKTEMSEVKEAVRLELQMSAMQAYLSDIQGANLGEEVTDISEFKDDLIYEIMFIREGNYKYTEPSKEFYNKDDFIDFEGLYYISKDITGKDRKYLYDSRTEVEYKIDSTTLYGKKVHSLEYLTLLEGGKVESRIAQLESTVVTVNGLSYYSPNLKGFNIQNTSVVYYNSDSNSKLTGESKEIAYTQYQDEQSRVIDSTYVFYDYKNKIWANVNVNINGVSSYWVWLPRYAYATDDSGNTSIVFIDIDDKPLNTEMDGETLAEGYTVHGAFNQGAKLSGIWMSKYEPTNIKSTSSNKVLEPDLSGFDENKTKIIYYNIADTKDSYEASISEYKAKGSVVKKDSNIYAAYSYDTENKIWANVKVEQDGIVSYWVWIPRYAYVSNGAGDSDIIFVDTNDIPIDTSKYSSKLPRGYTVHSAFNQSNKLSGIWMSKYEPTNVGIKNINNANIKLDFSNFDKDKTELIYYNTSDMSAEYKTKDINFYNKNGNSFVEGGVTYKLFDYSSENKIWANVKVEQDGVVSYWVWIPRYAYISNGAGDSSIIFIDENNNPIDTARYGSTLPEGYKVHEAFNQSENLLGIWMSKYEPTNTLTQ